MLQFPKLIIRACLDTKGIILGLLYLLQHFPYFFNRMNGTGRDKIIQYRHQQYTNHKYCNKQCQIRKPYMDITIHIGSYPDNPVRILQRSIPGNILFTTDGILQGTIFLIATDSALAVHLALMQFLLFNKVCCFFANASNGYDFIVGIQNLHNPIIPEHIIFVILVKMLCQNFLQNKANQLIPVIYPLVHQHSTFHTGTCLPGIYIAYAEITGQILFFHESQGSTGRIILTACHYHKIFIYNNNRLNIWLVALSLPQNLFQISSVCFRLRIPWIQRCLNLFLKETVTGYNFQILLYLLTKVFYIVNLGLTHSQQIFLNDLFHVLRVLIKHNHTT